MSVQGPNSRETERDLFLSLPLSVFLSLPVSVPTADFSSFTIPNWPAKQPSRPCCSVPLTHEQQQYNNRKGPPLLFTCRSCLQPPWGWILLLSLITVARAEINLQHSKTLRFVYEMVLQEQINWGVYLKVFYFGQRSAHHRQGAAVCG